MGCNNSKQPAPPIAEGGNQGRSVTSDQRKKASKFKKRRDSLAYNKAKMKKRADRNDGNRHAPDSMVTTVESPGRV